MAMPSDRDTVTHDGFGSEKGIESDTYSILSIAICGFMRLAFFRW
jgi:hypothetical protein